MNSEEEEYENEQNITVICFFPNNEMEDLKQGLCQINDSVVFHRDVESCITFIESIKKENIFLIISYSCIPQILSHIDIFRQVDFIWIYCSEQEKYKYFFHEDLNIIGIYDKFHLLFSSIEEQSISITKQFSKWTFYDEEDYLKRDLSKQSNDFLWIQLFHNVISHFPRNEQAKNQMFETCRLCCQGNNTELQLIDEFQRDYQSNDAIHWYLNNSFLQKMINKALQTKNIDQLYRLRYFLGDLIENLAREHRQIVESGIEDFIVYQLDKLTKYEFNYLKENQGKLMSIKRFLSINHDSLSSSLRSPRKSTQGVDRIDVRFEIHCHAKELGDNLIFADRIQFNKEPYQKQILFDLNTTFKLENIQQDKQIWIVRITAVNDGRILTQKYIDDTHRQIESLSIPVSDHSNITLSSLRGGAQR